MVARARARRRVVRLDPGAADPLRFLSFGAWTDADAVAGWRGSDEFRERLGRCRALCEKFEGHDYTAAAAQERM